MSRSKFCGNQLITSYANGGSSSKQFNRREQNKNFLKSCLSVQCRFNPTKNATDFYNKNAIPAQNKKYHFLTPGILSENPALKWTIFSIKNSQFEIELVN